VTGEGVCEKGRGRGWIVCGLSKWLTKTGRRVYSLSGILIQKTMDNMAGMNAATPSCHGHG
jgi:hypothetical protein